MCETVEIINISQQSKLVPFSSFLLFVTSFIIYSSNKGLHAGRGRERRDTFSSEAFGGTEVLFRGKRRLTMTGRMNSNIDEGYRRLDPLPDRVQGRKIVVSPKVDDEKGKSDLTEISFFFHTTSSSEWG